MSWHRMLAVLVYTFISVTHSACSDSAKEASGKDREKPISTTKPAAGKFNKAQSVQLSCDDQRGSGCVATYYTLNDEDPDTSSKKFTDPFTIDKTTTVKYFSVDAEGNTEAVKTAVFTFDQVAPKVVSSDPPDGGANVPLNGAEIRVTFDEDMDPASITNESFSVNNRLGPIMGSVTYDADTKAAVFTAEETLDAGIKYTVKLNNQIKDSAGNSIGASELSFNAASIAWVVVNGALLKMASNGEELIRIDEIDCQPIGENFRSTNPSLDEFVDLAIDQLSGAVWVADSSHNRVLKFDSNGNLLALTTINAPSNPVIDSRDGSIWVTESNPAEIFSSRIVKLTTLGTKLLESEYITGIIGPFAYDVINRNLWFSMLVDGLEGHQNVIFGDKNSNLTNVNLQNVATSFIGSNQKLHALSSGGTISILSVFSTSKEDSFTWSAGGLSGQIEKMDKNGNTVLTTEVAPGATEIKLMSEDQESGATWVSDIVRMIKYTRDGEVQVNESVPGFLTNIESDHIDGGVWVASDNSNADKLLRLDKLGNVMWEIQASAPPSIAVQKAYYKNIYVDMSGDDTSGLGVKTKPYRTVQKAIDVAQEGDVIRIGAGEYNERITSVKSLKLVGSGASNTRIIGTGTENTIEFVDVTHVTINGLSISGSEARYAGIYCDRCLDAVLEDNIVYKNDSGIEVVGDDNLIFVGNDLNIQPLEDSRYARAVIQQNIIHSNSSSGVFLRADATVRNNIVVSNSEEGIFSSVEPVVQIYNNTIDRNGNPNDGANGIYLTGNARVFGNIVTNNVSDSSLDRGGIETFSTASDYFTASPEFSFNNVHGNSAVDYAIEDFLPGPGAISEDPLFLDPINLDYHVSDTSKIVNAGPPNENPDAKAECGSPDRRNDMGAYGGLWGDW